MIKETTTIIAILLVLLTLFIPKKYMLLPYILGACFVPTDQRIIILGLDFTIVRILILTGVLRILVSGKVRVIKWNVFDKLVLAWALCGAMVYVIQWLDMRAVIYKCGVLYGVLGLYWLFRQLIYSWEDVKFIVKVLSICAFITVPSVALEWATGQNPFALLGTVITETREGNFRCQGAFPHSIMFGVFWATTVPLFIGMAFSEKSKVLYWSAAGAGVFSVFASTSSTCLATLFLVLIMYALFRWRQYMGRAWVALLLSLVGLHLIMNAPVWHLIARVNIVGASTGWYRFHLIDQAFKHFAEWALLGVRSTENWIVPGYRTVTDITNQYILEGIRGGIITLALFIAMLVVALKMVLRCYQQTHSKTELWLAWSVYIALSGHLFAFLGVSYFGQIGVLWYLVLGMIGFIVEENSKRRIYAC